MTMPPLPTDTDLDLEPDADGELDASVHSGIQSIEIDFRLPEVLAHTTGPMMLRDLACATPMNPAKVHRYLVSFTRLGPVTQTSEGRYDLGPFALEMGLVSLNRQDPMRHTRPATVTLRGEINHTVGLAVQGSQGPAIVHWKEASHPVTVSLCLGDATPMLNSVTGRVFGAHLPCAQIRSFIQREPDRIAAQGESTDSENPELPQTLEAHDAICAGTCLRGVLCIRGGVSPGISAMLLPVFDANGQLCLVLIALGAQSTFNITWGSPLERCLRLTAQQPSADLGYAAPNAP